MSPKMLAGALLSAGLTLGLAEANALPGSGFSPGNLQVTPILLGKGAGKVSNTEALPTSASSPVLTEASLHRALPKSRLARMDAATFYSFATAHAAEGRLLSGPALATIFASAKAGTRTAAGQADMGSHGFTSLDSVRSSPGTDSVPAPDAGVVADEDPPPEPDPCTGLDSLRTIACRDSLAEAAKAEARRFRAVGEDPATLDLGDPSAAERMTTLDATRTQGYFAQFFYDLGRGGGSDGDWDMDDWAAVVYVVVGVVVVGAFVIFGGKALYDLATNKDQARIFKEVGLRVSYSGTELETSDGSSLYREAYLMGLRFAIGLEQSVGLALTVEGGYIDLALRGVEGADYPVDFRGGYLVGGPMVRFGRGEPLSLSFEFLNGTSDHESIGWISKARMALQTKLLSGALLGAHIGAVFYDLSYYDGLVLRRGDFNRDLSLVIGMDAGWGF